MKRILSEEMSRSAYLQKKIQGCEELLQQWSKELVASRNRESRFKEAYQVQLTFSNI